MERLSLGGGLVLQRPSLGISSPLCDGASDLMEHKLGRMSCAKPLAFTDTRDDLPLMDAPVEAFPGIQNDLPFPESILGDHLSKSIRSSRSRLSSSCSEAEESTGDASTLSTSTRAPSDKHGASQNRAVSLSVSSSDPDDDDDDDEDSEATELPLTGVLQVAKGRCDLSQRVAVWAAQPQSSSVCRAVGQCLWTRRQVELTAEELSWYAIGEQPLAERLVRSLPLVQIDEVACVGCDVRVHVRTGIAPCVVRASSDTEAEFWAKAIRRAVANALKHEFPQGWDIPAMLTPRSRGSRRALSPRLVDKKPLPQTKCEVVQRLVDDTFFCKRKTKDRRGVQPLRLVVQEVVRVQNGAAWWEYNKERARVSEQLGEEFEPLAPQVLTATTGQDAMKAALGDLDPRCQEHWLFHGTTPEGVQGISDREFRMDFAGKHRGTLYGRGVYLAECSSKADEYSEEDEDGVCSMLLCRAALGRVMVNQEANPADDVEDVFKQSNCHSVCGDRWAAVGTYREFVVYQASQVYPAYIVKYRRVYETGFSTTIRQAFDDQDVRLIRSLVPFIGRQAHEHADLDVRYRLTLLLTTQDQIIAPVLTELLGDERPKVRRVAAEVLGRIAMESHLVQVFEDGTLHRRACQIATPACVAVPALARALNDASPKVRLAAADALAPMAHFARDAVPALAGRLSDDRVDVRRAAAIALGKIGVGSGAVEGLVRALGDEDSRVREATAMALGYIGANAASAVDALEHALTNDAYVEVRVAAAFALGQVCPQGLPVLVSCLSDVESAVRKASATALAFTTSDGAAGVLPELVNAMKDPEPDVRRAAACSLGHLGGSAATQGSVESLSVGLMDTDWQVRQASATALGRLGDKARPAVRRLVKVGLVDSNDAVRSAVARSLVDLGHRFMLGATTRKLVEQEMTVRLRDHCDDVRNAAKMYLHRGSQEDDVLEEIGAARRGVVHRLSGQDLGPRQWFTS